MKEIEFTKPITGGNHLIVPGHLLAQIGYVAGEPVDVIVRYHPKNRIEED
jgi:hypothetical protein